jgi:ankyrin repeat protein
MSIEDEIKESLEKKDLEKFREIISRPKIHINDIFGDGILHYMLEHNKDISIEFIQALLEQASINLNKENSKNGLLALLCTDREGIQDLLLGNVRFNVNKVLDKKNMMCWALENNKLGLLKKLINHPQIDLLGEDNTDEEKNAVIQSMKNPEAFKLFLESPKMNVDAVGWNGIIIPLDYALKKIWIDSSLLLLEKGADMNISTVTGRYTLSIAERIVELGNPVLIKFLLDNFGKVKNTDRLLIIAIMEKNRNFTYSSMEHDMDLIGTLLRNKCLLSQRALLESLGSIDVLETIIVNLDEGINLEKEETVLETVLVSENIELVNKLVKTKFALKHKIFILGLFDKILNPLILYSILSADELVRDQVDVIFLRNNYITFMTLLKMGEAGIERINHLLDISSVQLPLMFPPLGVLIKTGTELTINLAKKLLEHHGVIPQSTIEIDYFIEQKRVDILEILIKKEIKKEIRLNVFGKTLTPFSFINLVNLLGGNTELLEMLVTKLQQNDRGERIIVNSLQMFIKRNPEIVIRIIKTTGFKLDMLFKEMRVSISEESETPLLFDLLKELPTEEYKNEILSILRTGGKIQKLKQLNILDYFINIDDIESVRFLMNNSDLVDSITLWALMDDSPKFMLDNLRELFDRFEPEKFILNDALPVILNKIYLYSSEIFSNDVLTAVIKHPKYNPKELYQDESGNQHTQLQIILTVIELAQTEEDIYNLVNVFQQLLTHPETDPNQLNGPVNEDTTKTVLDTLLLNYINEYREQQYDYDKPFHMILQMLLMHPDLNMTPHYHFHRSVCQKRIGDLFTHMISRDEFDMDSAFLLHIICSEGNDIFLSVLLTLDTFDINYSIDEETALHVCLKYDQDSCAKMLIDDSRINLSLLENGKNYAEIAVKHNRLELVKILKERGVKDDRHERMEMEATEYDARMATMGRRKHGKLKELLDIYDDILKERENPDARPGSITLFSKSLCPFCLVLLEKEEPGECVYLAGHECHPDVRNEALMAKYLGPTWETAHFDVCCTCGRPGNNHGHYRIVPDGETSSLAAPGPMADHWICNEHNGGGGKEEMVVRLVGILTYLKRRIDSEEHLEDNAELGRQMSLEADKALFDQSMKDRAALIFQNRAWNANSTIAPYKRFNAPRVAAAAAAIPQEVREPIVHIDNRLKGVDEKDSCGYCLEERDDLYRPHESDTSFICGVCLYKTVCISPYRTVTCGLGCNPRKQIHKEDVEALMGGQLCGLMAPIADEEEAQARRNENARRAARNPQLEGDSEDSDSEHSDLEEGEIRY